MTAPPDPRGPSGIRGRSPPRAEEVAVRLSGAERRVPSGTRVMDLLPAEVEGHLVVAGLLGQKPVSLSTQLWTDAEVAPLTSASWEGRRVFTRSAGLLLLEAAHTIDPALEVRLGRSLGATQIVEVPAVPAAERSGLAARIAAGMARLADEDR